MGLGEWIRIGLCKIGGPQIAHSYDNLHWMNTIVGLLQCAAGFLPCNVTEKGMVSHPKGLRTKTRTKSSQPPLISPTLLKASTWLDLFNPLDLINYNQQMAQSYNVDIMESLDYDLLNFLFLPENLYDHSFYALHYIEIVTRPGLKNPTDLPESNTT